ncbi:hypothetical protein D1013_08275 [Euzebyella marina]|uniref:Uncharacterized protein n=2 Tax=Euzebyella marina TaxID=1761453 RepID=A0A3G2L591_9FLAO|nr:hypothetical protein D1013_08275 [Euzebyella marina]
MYMQTRQSLLIVVALFIGIIAVGQSKIDRIKAIPPEEMAQKITALQKDKLDLNETQEAEIMAINLKAAQDRRSILENSSLIKMRKEMKVVQEYTDNKITSVLNPNQIELYATNKENIRQEVREYFEIQ